MDDVRPNIILIHCHDLGRYLGCYSYDIQTPRIEQLADSGAVFEQHFGTAPQCSPSRGSLMTGQYPHVNGLIGLAHGHWEIDERERTLPEYLNDEGYHTHMFGLQHVTQNTTTLGYDKIHSKSNLYPGVSPIVHEGNRAKNVAANFESILESESYEEPFFASLGFFEIHRSEQNGLFVFETPNGSPADPYEIDPLPYLPDRRGIREDLAEMHSMVYAIDEAVGTICDAVSAAGIDEETMILLTTEHGIPFPRAKGSCYDPGIEAALIIRYPGVADSGSRYDELLSNVDILPTVLDIIDAEIPDRINGRSFLSLLTGDAYTPRKKVFAEMTWHDMYNPVRMIRTDQYKYIRSFWHLPKVYLPTDVFASKAGRELRERYSVPTRPYEELYNLEQSPHETENVIFESRHESVRIELTKALCEWMEDTDDPLLDGPVVPGDFDHIQSWPRIPGSNTEHN